MAAIEIYSKRILFEGPSLPSSHVCICIDVVVAAAVVVVVVVVIDAGIAVLTKQLLCCCCR